MSSSERINVIRAEVESVIKEASNLRSEGKGKEAEKLLSEKIMVLVRDRDNYVSIGRGMGAVTGAVFAYIVSILIPGGSLATLIPGLLGSGYLGERVGKYTGEKLTSEEYCQVLKDLHSNLLQPETEPQDTELLPFWKAYIILETPMDIFAVVDGSGASFTGRIFRSIKRLIGRNLFALAVEAAGKDSPNFRLLQAMTTLYLKGEIRSADSRLVAEHIYRSEKENKTVNRLLGHIYYLDMADFAQLRSRHKQEFSEDLSVLFESDYKANPDNKQAIENLAQLYLEENSTTAKTIEVFVKAVDHSISPVARYALALMKALNWDKEALKGQIKAISVLVEQQDDILERRMITNEKMHLLEDVLATYAADNDLSDEKYETLIIRAFLRTDTNESLNIHVGKLFLRGHFERIKEGSRYETFIRQLNTVLFPLRDRLTEEEQKKLATHYSSHELSQKTDKLFGATMLIEQKEGAQALDLLTEIRKDRGKGLSSYEKLESARLLAIANEMNGKIKRAYELFKGITLVETSQELLDSIFEFAVKLLTVHERPTMARDAFTLIKSCDPEYSHHELGPIENYYKEFQSVFDYYDEDSIKKVGGGGMAVVFSGKEKLTDHVHIIKQLRTDLGTPSEARRFQRLFSSEIKAIRKLNESDHPGSRNIVKLYYQSSDEESFCYSMEKLDEILSDTVAEKKLTYEEAASIIKDIGKGLACAHAEGIVHRDLNPRNVGMKDGVVKIFDFGTAHILRTTIHLRRAVDTVSERDAENVIIGTPCYMSPEQAAGRQFDERSDIFSLACVAFELLTGELAFPGRLGSQVLTVGNCEESLKELRDKLEEKDVPKDSIDVIIKALAAYPEDRPETVEQFIEIL